MEKGKVFSCNTDIYSVFITNLAYILASKMTYNLISGKK